MTQERFGEIVGIEQQSVSRLIGRGILPRDGTAREWFRAYCGRLREEAAGRATDGELNLAHERARLAKEQADGAALKNAVARGEYAPISLLGEVLGVASSAIAQRLDGFEGLLAKMAPDIPEKAKQGLLSLVAKARNDWAKETIALVDRRIAQLAAGDDAPDLDAPDAPLEEAGNALSPALLEPGTAADCGCADGADAPAALAPDADVCTPAAGADAAGAADEEAP